MKVQKKSDEKKVLRRILSIVLHYNLLIHRIKANNNNKY